MALTFTIDQNTIGIIGDAGEGRAIGTGFVFIKPNWVVTAKHVVIRREDGMPREALIFQHNRSDEVPASVLFAHPTYDLAVLGLGTTVCRRPLFPGYEELIGRGGLVCCGYTPSLTDEAAGTQAIYVNQIVDRPQWKRHSLRV